MPSKRLKFRVENNSGIFKFFRGDDRMFQLLEADFPDLISGNVWLTITETPETGDTMRVHNTTYPLMNGCAGIMYIQDFVVLRKLYPMLQKPGYYKLTFKEAK
jgi:hypothetical protein